MTTATVEHHTYAKNETPLVMLPHYSIRGGTTFRCVQDDCDGEHHFWCSCER